MSEVRSGKDKMYVQLTPNLTCREVVCDTSTQQQQHTQYIPTKWSLGKVKCKQSIPLS